MAPSATQTYEKLTKNQPIQIRKAKSIGLQTEEAWKAKVQDYGNNVLKSETYMRDYCFIIERLEKARLQRDMPNKYLDDLDFISDYQTNENMKNTYLQRKRNDSEIRVNMGTGEKKIEAVYNSLLALNMQHEVLAFDTDDYELVELGRDFTSIVSRTNTIEEDDDFWQEAIIELLTQRAVFIEECFLDYYTRDGKRRVRKAKKQLVSGLKMYLGDVSIPMYRYNEQPYIVKYERMHWRRAYELYHHLPNFAHVLAGFTPNSTYGQAFAYRFGDLSSEEVEVIQYISLPDNEQNVIIQGVAMYDFGSPETKIPWEFDGYNIQGFTLKSMGTDYAYGKPLTASAKPLASLQNEMIRSLLRKFFQALEPPVAVRGDKRLTRDIWDAGAVASGISKNDYEKLIDHDGVTDSEFKMYSFIESKVQEFVGAGNLQQGLAESDKATATEIMQRQQEAARQLGLAVAALIRMKREMTKLRISTIFDFYLKQSKTMFTPITGKEEEFFAGFSAGNQMLDNQRLGTKRVEFIGRDLNDEEKQRVFDYEEDQAKLGKHVRLKTINTKKLKDMYLHWYVAVVAKQKNGSMMDRLTFKDKFVNAQAISTVTQVPLNKDKVIDDFESKWEAHDWFQNEALENKQPEIPEEKQAQFAEMESKLESLKNSQFANGLEGGATQIPTPVA